MRSRPLSRTKREMPCPSIPAARVAPLLFQERPRQLHDAVHAGGQSEHRADEIGDSAPARPVIYQPPQEQPDRHRNSKNEAKLGGEGDCLPQSKSAHGMAPYADPRQYNIGSPRRLDEARIPQS